MKDEVVGLRKHHKLQQVSVAKPKYPELQVCFAMVPSHVNFHSMHRLPSNEKDQINMSTLYYYI